MKIILLLIIIKNLFFQTLSIEKKHSNKTKQKDKVTSPISPSTSVTKEYLCKLQYIIDQRYSYIEKIDHDLENPLAKLISSTDSDYKKTKLYQEIKHLERIFAEDESIYVKTNKINLKCSTFAYDLTSTNPLLQEHPVNPDYCKYWEEIEHHAELAAKAKEHCFNQPTNDLMEHCFNTHYKEVSILYSQKIKNINDINYIEYKKLNQPPQCGSIVK